MSGAAFGTGLIISVTGVKKKYPPEPAVLASQVRMHSRLVTLIKNIIALVASYNGKYFCCALK